MRFRKILNNILDEFKQDFDNLLIYFPGRLGCFLRYAVYRRRFKSCGNNIHISHSVFFKGFENIEIGDDIWLGPYNSIFAESNIGEAKIKIGNHISLNSNVMINADVKGEIIIEDNVLIGPNVVIRASGHRYEDIDMPIRKQGHHKGRIIIKEDVWIGANVVILPNVTIGQGAVIGAGAVVTKDVESYSIVAGVPAKKIKSRIE